MCERGTQKNIYATEDTLYYCQNVSRFCKYWSTRSSAVTNSAVIFFYLPLIVFCLFNDPLATIISDRRREELLVGGKVAPTAFVTELVDAER